MTKNQINKFGKEIRKKLQNNKEVSIPELESLQNFRLSFSHGLNTTFNILGEIINTIDDKTILSSRVKRIESILSKISRQPTMALANMGDIAGCRIIFDNTSSLQMVRLEIVIIVDTKIS